MENAASSSDDSSSSSESLSYDPFSGFSCLCSSTSVMTGGDYSSGLSGCSTLVSSSSSSSSSDFCADFFSSSSTGSSTFSTFSTFWVLVFCSSWSLSVCELESSSSELASPFSASANLASLFSRYFWRLAYFLEILAAAFYSSSSFFYFFSSNAAYFFASFSNLRAFALSRPSFTLLFPASILYYSTLCPTFFSAPFFLFFLGSHLISSVS